MRSIRELSRRAAILYGGGADAQGRYEIYMEEAWREFVHRTGGIYTRTTTVALSLTARSFDLPTRLREITENGVYLYYTPRDIDTIARVDGVVTVVTDEVHGLETDMQIGIDDVTPVGDTEFDGGPFTVTVLDTTSFTYEEDEDDDTGTGGEVVCGYDAKALTPKYNVEDSNAAYYSTTGSPAEYYFPDALTIALTPMTDGTYPELFIVYDAEESDTLDLDDELDPQAFVEPGIVAYAAGRAGDLDKAEAQMLFDKSIADWRGARSQRENVHRYGENW